MRKRGQATALANKCYGGSRPADAWTLDVTSQGYKHTFMIPKLCGNLALVSSQKVEEPEEGRSTDLSARRHLL